MNHADIVMHTSNHSHSKVHAGYTLIELMISIVLGLLLVAAASQLMVGGMVSSRLQQGAADVQEGGMFGLDYLAKDIRLANYGNTQNLVLTDATPSGGVVLSTTNLSVTPAVSAGLLSHSDSDSTSTGNEWTGATKVTVSGATASVSDQLTIQFAAPAAMTNCEGASVNAGVQVVQRYFLRPDTTDANSLVLACAAGSVSGGVLTGLNGAGQVIIPRVEQFRVLLGTQSNATAGWRYYSIHDYVALAATSKTQIKSIQLAVLVRSVDNTNSNLIVPGQSLTMLDQTVTPTATASTNRYVRRVYTTTIALRNGLGTS